MRIANKLVLLALGIFMSLASLATPSSDKLFSLAFTISQDGKVISTPTVVVREGVAGSVAVSGSDDIKLSFTVTDLGDNKLKVATQLESGGAKSSPEIVVRPKQAARVSVGGLEMQIVADRFTRNDS